MGVIQWSFQGVGHFGVVRMERARMVIGRASECAQFLSMCPGRRSGPVAFVTSMEERSLRVQRVRRSVKVVIVGQVADGVRVGGVVGFLKLVSEVFAKRFALLVASCVQFPFSSLSEGTEGGAEALLRSCRFRDHHCFEPLGGVLSFSRSLSL